MPTLPYVPFTWLEGITRLGPTRLNALEQGAGAAIPKPADIIDGEAAVWDNAAGGWSTSSVKKIKSGSFAGIKNVDVDAAAAIAYTKLALAGSIVDADIAGGAAIAFSKLAGVASAPTIGTTLPGSPADGQEAILVDSLTNPTYQWRFRYHSGSSNADKWEFVGGTPIFAEVTTAEATASTTYAALTTAGPSITIPRAGVYIVEHGYRLSVAAGVATGSFMSYDIGGTGAVDADAIIFTQPGNANHIPGGLSRKRVKTGLAAATALVSKYKQSAANSQTFADRWMAVIPIRVS